MYLLLYLYHLHTSLLRFSYMLQNIVVNAPDDLYTYLTFNYAQCYIQINNLNDLNLKLIMVL